MEGCIAVHSVIIGAGLGAKSVSSSENVTDLVTLTFALFFHQLFEGIALGIAAVLGKLDVSAC